MISEKSKHRNVKYESIDAGFRFGRIHSSDKAAVLAVEQGILFSILRK